MKSEGKLIRKPQQRGRRFGFSQEELDLYGLAADDAESASTYLSLKAWLKVVQFAFMDPDWMPVLDNKWFFAQSFSAAGIPVPRALGILHPANGFWLGGAPLRNQRDLELWVDSRQASAFVLKPVGGWAGEGVQIITSIEHTSNHAVLHFADGSTGSVENLWQRAMTGPTGAGVRGHLVEEHLDSSSTLEAIGFTYPYSLKLVTILEDEGDPFLVMAAAVVGRRGEMVNKLPLGALTIGIDVETGSLGFGRTHPQFGSRSHSTHPDNGIKFQGENIPRWGEIVDLVCRAARVALGCRVVCWEVMLGDKGPRLIEGNLGFGISVFQVHTQGLIGHEFGRRLKALGADLPDGTAEWERRHAPPNLGRRAFRRLAREGRRFALRSH